MSACAGGIRRGMRGSGRAGAVLAHAILRSARGLRRNRMRPGGNLRVEGFGSGLRGDGRRFLLAAHFYPHVVPAAGRDHDKTMLTAGSVDLVLDDPDIVERTKLRRRQHLREHRQDGVGRQRTRG
jgi:hypothetical protein